MAKDKADEDIFEEMFEKQVHDFLDQHMHLIKEEQNVFKMAKKFEERYQYVIARSRENVDKKIENVKKRNEVLFNKLISDRKEVIKKEMDNIESDIAESLKEHDKISKEQEDILNLLYNEKKASLIEKILKELGFEFI